MTKTKTEKQARIKQLRKIITYHQKRYYEEDAPEISDAAYDSLLLELKELEGATDETKDSLLNPVGAKPSEAFSKVKHKVRQWSYDNVFTEAELRDWEKKVERYLRGNDVNFASLTYVVEHKIDGLKLVLEYTGGILVRAATRGDGAVGEDVTHTAQEITDIPNQLKRPVDAIIVGEVWLSFKEFERINKVRSKTGEPLYANPRNTAAGSLRQLDAQITKKRKLSFFAYDLDYFDGRQAELAAPTTQEEELKLLKQLGCNVNPHNKKCKNIEEIITYYQQWVPKRGALDYGVDGVVVKVNDIELQKAAGHTAKSPRYGIAFKFPSEEATTVVEDIQLQVGRTGVITPVAHLRPVLIAGSTVARATLHNEDEITRLDIRIGDTVILKKAGDVIPKVLEVVKDLRPKNTKPYFFPKKVAGCGGDGSIERVPGEAAYRCVDRSGDTLNRRRLYYFVSKQALNMDGIGPRVIDQLLDVGLVSEPADLFTLEVGDFLTLEGFKEKSAKNAIEAIHNARSIPLYRFLIGLSIDGVGEETARLLAEQFGALEKLLKASKSELAAIHGIGEVIAGDFYDWVREKQNKNIIEDLLKHITITEVKAAKKSAAFNGKTLVFTGTLPTLSRDEAKARARAAGARIASSVSKNTDYVVLGEEAGSKAEKAAELGVKTLSEEEFIQLLN